MNGKVGFSTYKGTKTVLRSGSFYFSWGILFYSTLLGSVHNAYPTDEPSSADIETGSVELIVLEGKNLKFATSAFESKCATCHEEDGTALGDPSMDLTDDTWNHGGALEEIAKTIREGVPDTQMKPQGGNFTDEEIADLAKYVKLLADKMHIKTEEPRLEAATELTNEVTSKLPPLTASEVASASDVTITETFRANFIDDYIFSKMKADGIPHADLSTDEEFNRRIYLDLWGRIPVGSEVSGFVADEDPDKRTKLIDMLLGLDPENQTGHIDSRGPWNVNGIFLDKWAGYFAGLFGWGGKPFRDWIRQNLMFNIPYDFIVREILTATSLNALQEGPAGALAALEIDGGDDGLEVLHEDSCDEMAVFATKTFFGVNLQCVSCHDGADHLEDISLWHSKRKRVEFWRQAAFFGNTRINLPNRRSGMTLYDGPALRPEKIWQGRELDNQKFETPPNAVGALGYRMEAQSLVRVTRDLNADVYPEFYTTKETPAVGANLREEFARMITSDFQFAKATVNLIWSLFMTVGIVDPPFNWDLDRQDPNNPPPEPWTIQPSHPELLDALALYFQETNYDLRLLMRLICRSKAYQLSSRFESEYEPEYDKYYARKLVRRLSSTEIYDALAQATNVFGHGTKYVSSPGGTRDSELNRFMSFLGGGEGVVPVSMMMNSGIVKEKVKAGAEGGRLNKLLTNDPPVSPMCIVEDLFLSTLSRYPTSQEVVKSMRHIEQYDDEGLENLLWALVNKLEFVVNY